jgi:hypothetical protein
MKYAFLSAVIAGASVAFVPSIRAEEPASQPAAEAEKSAGPVDFRKIKDVMPDTLGGIKRTDNTGQRMSMGEMKVATVSATYATETEGDTPQPTVIVQVMDYGQSEVSKAAAAWTQLDIDSESDTGYQKTTKAQGHPAMESYQTDAKQGTLMILVADRIIVNVTTSSISVEQFKKLSDELPLKKLAELVK